MYAYLFIISAAWTFQFIPTLVIALIAVAFLGMLVQNRIVVNRVRRRLAETDFTSKMMEQAVKINASNVVRFAIHEGIIEQLYGSIFPERALTVEEWISHVHPGDIEETLRRFRRMMAGKTLREDFFYRSAEQFYAHEQNNGRDEKPCQILGTPVTERMLGVGGTAGNTKAEDHCQQSPRIG